MKRAFFLLLTGALASACSAIIEPNIARLGDAGPPAFDSGLPVPCTTPGVIETVPCGNCGTVQRFCSGTGVWEYGACSAQGVCAPGAMESVPCGNCGTQTSRCSAFCTWESTGLCTGEGECRAGSRARSSAGCPSGQTQEVLCGDTCTYAPAGACMADSCPTPGTIENVSCGLCGIQSRFCAATNVWEYGPCTGEGGECVPGTLDAVACGNCGTIESRCTTACQWEPIGACMGEGECMPGTVGTSSSGCPDGQVRTLTCSEACAYVVTSPCSFR